MLSLRFIGPIYSAVSGIEITSVEVGSSTNPAATADGGYSTNPIAISQTQDPIFVLSRTSVVELYDSSKD